MSREKTISKDIFITDNLINNRFNIGNIYGQYGSFKTIYSFSNEDLISCFNNFNFNGKSILSVLASSDQVLDMFLRGTSSIDTFDINPLTKHYFYLKKATLNYNFPIDFYISFFNNNNINNPFYMNDRTFNKIKNLIGGLSQKYWEYVFENFAPDEIAYGIFCRDTTDNEFLKYSVAYLNSPDNFSKISNIVNDIKFTKADIRTIKSHINKTYDYIYLSNIMQYVEQIYISDNYLQSLKMYKKLLESLSSCLNNNGKIINYIFNYDMIEKKQLIDYVFDSPNYSQKELNPTDGILVYTKTN